MKKLFLPLVFIGAASFFIYQNHRVEAQVPSSSFQSTNNIVAKVDVTGQTASIGLTSLYAVPASAPGLYRYCVYLVLTTTATTSTLPNATVSFTDNETNTVVPSPPFVTVSNTANSVGVGVGSVANNCYEFIPKAGTTINYGSASYASSPAATMQYSLHGRLEYLGNN